MDDVVQVAIYGMAAYTGPDETELRNASSGGRSSFTGSSCSSSSCGGGY
ncbi:hypothetical protein [Herbidospora galbida]|nr:hypothetical protein [Herbidospora galbida]